MKKKFDFKLTITLVSLFIGFLLMVFGNNKYCLGFGMVLLGLSVGFYAYYKTQKINEDLKEIDQEIAEIDENDFLTLQEAYTVKRKMKKQKTSLNFVFYVFAFLLVVCGVVSLF